MKTADEWVERYFNANREDTGPEAFDQHIAHVEAIQRDAIESQVMAKMEAFDVMKQTLAEIVFIGAAGLTGKIKNRHKFTGPGEPPK